MTLRILVGDVRDKLRDLPDESVHCCVTSPPYFGLRDYGTAQWAGGDPACDHSPEARGGRFATSVSSKQASNSGRGTASRRDCPCGAMRADRQIGLEPSPDEYVAALVAVFREVRRVLRDDGTLWLNIGDSYAGSWGAQGHRISESDEPSWHSSQIKNHPKRGSNTGTIRSPGLKQKDMIGIPWLLAFALRNDGWWLRSDIIWSKPNPMPESVIDRPTKAHEYLFLLAKAERYYYDAEAISEPCNYPEGSWGRTSKYDGDTSGKFRTMYGDGRRWEGAENRNKRSVWTVATAPYSEAHFATFPPALIEPCVLAGCPEGGTVLDPFGGAGTTGLVADRLGRNALLIELNPDYAKMALARIARDAPLFFNVAT